MKFAAIMPEAGLPILEQTKHSCHMVLGQEALKSELLRSWYRARTVSGDFIMVDNGTAEQDTPPFADIVSVARDIGADEIILPDVIGDWEASVVATTDQHALQLVPAWQRVIAPHGETRVEFACCMDVIDTKMEYKTIALTKGLERIPGGRAWCISWLIENGYTDKHPIHLLGAWKKPREDLRRLTTIHPGIRSIDTAAPLAYAQAGLPMDHEERISMDWERKFDMQRAFDYFLQFRRWCWEV